MNHLLKTIQYSLLFYTCLSFIYAQDRKPNIILILTDDLGYGDVSFLNSDSKIKTPQMDQLAKEGVYLTDAHSPSSVCTPSRYSILSGDYAWRSENARGVSMPWAEPAFTQKDITISSLLQKSGYHTVCIGKWHLGFIWPWKRAYTRDEIKIKSDSIATCDMFDFSQPITGGPLARGFDYYFGDDVPNFPPYAFIENESLTCDPVDTIGKDFKPIGHSGSIHGDGPGQKNWQMDQVLPTITTKAVSYIDKMAQEDKPFFLFFTPTSPHTPIVPTKEFQGSSKADYYGDFVVQTDHSIGQIIDTLKKNDLFENTFIVISSDNGPSGFVQKLLQTHDHRSTGPFRGRKGDIWEGGHRVPFIASWPNGGIKGGLEIKDLFVLTDLYATFATAAGLTLKDLKDSIDQTNTLKGNGGSRSEIVSHHSKRLALRQNEWVLLLGGGGKGGNGKPTEPEWRRQIYGIQSPDAPIQLFNLNEDLGQKVNVAKNFPERVKKMSERLQQMKRGAR